MTLYIWLSLISFIVGRWTVERSIRYKMGDKIVDNASTLLKNRKLVGESVEIAVTTSWKARGHDWELSIKEKEQS